MKLVLWVLTFVWTVSGACSVEAAVVNGRVIFEGEEPPVEVIAVRSDTSTCGYEQTVRRILLGAGGGVSDALVTVVGSEGAPEPAEGLLDQVDCQFVPAVQVLPAGSVLNITSSDPVLHNAHGFFEDGSTAFNIAVPVAGMELPILMERPGVIKLRCDAGHTWMKAFVLVTERTHYAQTAEDGGFTLKSMEPGDYELEVWQEWLGKSRHSVHVVDGENDITLTLRPE